jgi:putative DNA primase/helicase
METINTPQAQTETTLQENSVLVVNKSSNGCGCAARIVERQTSSVTETSSVTDLRNPQPVKYENAAQETKPQTVKPQTERIYRYEDEKGELLYEVIRYEPKGFSQRRPDPNKKGEYIYNMQGVRRVLYKLPGLAATHRDIPVYIVEGEKDADRLWSLGLPAATNPGGAGKWLPEFNESLRGRPVGILPDNDEPGRRHAQKVAESLCNAAACVKIVELPGLPHKGDVSDWLDAGHKFGELSILYDETPEYKPAQTESSKGCGYAARNGYVGRNTTDETSSATDSRDTQPSFNSVSAVKENWTRKADVVKMSEVEPEDVKWLWQGRFPLGMITLLVGDPDLGKSYFSMYVASIVSNGGSWPDGSACDAAEALILNAEDSLASTVRKRLHNLGADAEKIIAIRAMTENTEDGQFADHFNIASDRIYLEEVLKENPGIRLVIIDPLSAYFGSADTFKESTVRAILSPLADTAARFNVALICIMHLNKGTSSKALYRTQGSLAFPAAARTVWLVSNDPANPESKRRFLINTKFNIGDKPNSLAFEIKDGKVIFETEPVNVTAQDIFVSNKGPEPTKRLEAAEWLTEILGKVDSMNSSEIFKLGEKEGIKKKTLYRAKKELGIIASSVTDKGIIKSWFWSLPKEENGFKAGPLELQAFGNEEDTLKISLKTKMANT